MGKPADDPARIQLVDAIDALLAQTQCQACGHPACRPYAEAIADGDGIDRCRPGGEATVRALAGLLGRPLVPPAEAPLPERVAWIDAERCIGCARCLPPCPVDAIAGLQPFLHTVLTEHCTGCGLCVAPCPVDCIELRVLHAGTDDSPAARAPDPSRRATLRARWEAHRTRAARRQQAASAQRARRLAERRQARGSAANDVQS